MRRANLFALVLSLIAILVAYVVGERIFEQMAHLEDEMAYVWQAQAIAGGELTVPIPTEPKSFLVPFVIDYNGHRFGKYPLGWPVVLALGVALGIRAWINPLLAGLGVWLTYRLGQRTFGPGVGLLAAVLTITSPFFLVNSGSLLSHPFGLVLSAAFGLAWLDAFGEPELPPGGRRTLAVWTAGLLLGVMILTRPLTAVAVALPFGLHGLWLLLRGSWATRRAVLLVGSLALVLSGLHFLWQYAVTGDPLLNPYTLWWEYDSLGFKPGVGRNVGGHSLQQAWINTRYSLQGGFPDLFGWGAFSWAFLPLGVWVLLRLPKGLRQDALLLAAVFPMLVVVYMLYWIGSSLFGPRYYYEGLYSLTLLTAAGLMWLAGLPVRLGQYWERPADRVGWARIGLVVIALIALVSVNVTQYLPRRLQSMYGLYGVSRSRLEPFLDPSMQKYAPALVIVHPEKKWTEYGSLLELMDPFLETPFIFVHTRNPDANANVIAAFPDRKVYHYYPDDPYVLYVEKRADK